MEKQRELKLKERFAVFELAAKTSEDRELVRAAKDLIQELAAAGSISATDLRGPRKVAHFRDEYFELSNFLERPISAVLLDESYEFSSAEQLFQAVKVLYTDLGRKDKIHWIEKIFEAKTPGGAKGLGKSIPKLNLTEWNKARLDVMAEVLRGKFLQLQELKEALLATGTAYLEEGNSWNDRYWGVSGGSGENKLGELLMELRSKILTDPDYTDNYIPHFGKEA